MGSAILHNFANWSNEFMGPYLGEDAEEFKALGAQYTRVESAWVMLTEQEAFLPRLDLPEGRRFAILTDVHIGSAGRDDLLRIAVKEINELAPEFVVIPGDITEDGEPDQFRLVKGIFDELESPYYVVMGNHDAVQRSTREATGERFYEETFGEEPHDHVVECGDLQVALVDSTDPTASPFPDWDISRGHVGGIAAGTDSGALKPGQARALAQRLDPSRRTLLVQHHELHPFPGMPPVKFALREEDAAEELDALGRHNVIGVVAGHTHRSAVLPVGDRSLTQLEIPALKDWPHAYSVGVVTEDEVHVVVRQIGEPAVVWDWSKGMPNFMRRFATGPLSDLSYAFTV
jgi:3',5'-cyclic AMP phosphodiesterase CpdA